MRFRIYRDRSERIIGFSQRVYIDKVLDRFNIDNAMIYTRPNVSCALTMTSRYQLCSGYDHWTAIKNVLK